jgi:hypothetical protein
MIVIDLFSPILSSNQSRGPEIVLGLDVLDFRLVWSVQYAHWYRKHSIALDLVRYAEERSSTQKLTSACSRIASSMTS